MRTPAPAVVLAIVVSLCGCATGVRPDGEVARAVERAEWRRTQEKAVAAAALASADDGLPVALPARGEDLSAEDAPGEDVLELTEGTAEAASYSFRPFDTDDFDTESDSGRADGIAADQKRGLPKLRLQLFKLNVNGVPVDLKCSLKNKFLMFGAKMRL